MFTAGLLQEAADQGDGFGLIQEWDKARAGDFGETHVGAAGAHLSCRFWCQQVRIRAPDQREGQAPCSVSKSGQRSTGGPFEGLQEGVARRAGS